MKSTLAILIAVCVTVATGAVQAQNRVDTGVRDRVVNVDPKRPDAGNENSSWCDDGDGLQCYYFNCYEDDYNGVSECELYTINTSDPDFP